MFNFGGVCTSLRKIEIWNETGAPSYHPTSRHDGSNACWMSTGASHNCPLRRWGDVRHVPCKSDRNQMNLKSKGLINLHMNSSHPPLKPLKKLFRLNQYFSGIKISQTTNGLDIDGAKNCGNDSMHLFKLVYCIKNNGFFIESSSL